MTEPRTDAAPWMRMKNALAAFEAWAAVVIPMLENAGDYESAAFGKDRIEQSENARTTVNRKAAALDRDALARALVAVAMPAYETDLEPMVDDYDYTDRVIELYQRFRTTPPSKKVAP